MHYLRLCFAEIHILEKSKEVAIKCQQNNEFLVNGKSVDIKNIECQKPNTAGVSISNVNCLNGGKLLDIGFETSGGFAKYILVCYNFENAAVVYTYHIIPGNSIDGLYIPPPITYFEIFSDS